MITKISLLSALFLLVSNVCLAIEPVYEGSDGIREQVFATNCLFCHSSDKTGAERNGAPSSVNWDTFAAARPFADRAIVRAVETMTMPPFFSGLPTLNEEQKAAMLAWRQTGFPRYPTNATFDFVPQLLTLPVVQVGDTRYRAILRLVELANSTFGFGFLLESAELTQDSSDTTVVFIPETGEVSMPAVDLLNNPGPETRVSAEMLLIPGAPPGSLLFEMTSLTFIE